jgi:hypothetical protein
MLRVSCLLAAACCGLCVASRVNAAGPDVIVGDLYQTAYYGSVGNLHGYAVGTVSCNVGDQNLLWISTTNQHPVIAQNMYRLANGRFEQIGQSWLKHGFTALTQNLCDTCSGQGGSVLGVGCSDPYSASLNGGQTRLGPRSEVNALTGDYPYPYLLHFQETGNAIFKRIQVHTNDITPAMNPGALYFVEGQYITVDDAQFGNGYNNASYRRVTVNGSLTLNLQGTTQREKPAIMAWAEHGLGVGVPDPDVNLVSTDDPQGGRFWVASKATDLGGGQWHYEYAVFNLNSDRGMRGFDVPRGAGGVETGIGWHGVNYHSDEPYTNAPWTSSVAPTSVHWQTDLYDADPNANALRWGTMYNYRFNSNQPPTDSVATIELFKPGAGRWVPADVVAPAAPDCNTNGTDDGLDAAAGPDCNANGIPDVCELPRNDCNENGIPEECDTTADCNTNDVPDTCELAGNDCDSNGVPDDCQPDCNTDGTIDVCEDGGDCNSNGIHDGCDADCNTNDVADECELADELAEDCNTNGRLDRCDTDLDVDLVSSLITPLYGDTAGPAVWVFSHAPAALAAVTLTASWDCDCGSATETFDVDINGIFVGAGGGTGASSTCQTGEATYVIEQADWNDAVALGAGVVTITATASATVNQAACGGEITFHLEYDATEDSNGDGVVDSCESSVMCAGCAGDLSADNVIDGDDIDGFVAAYLTGGYDPCLDMDASGALDSVDVAMFASALLNGAACP